MKPAFTTLLDAMYDSCSPALRAIIDREVEQIALYEEEIFCYRLDEILRRQLRRAWLVRRKKITTKRRKRK